MQWTDRIRQVKILLVAAAILIAIASLAVSHFLTRDLKIKERDNMEVWAEAMRSLSQADENTDLSLVLKVINSNNTIPVIVLDHQGNVTDFRNVRLQAKDNADSLRQIRQMGAELKAAGRVIRINLSSKDYIDVCYDDSLLLRRLTLYPLCSLAW